MKVALILLVLAGTLQAQEYSVIDLGQFRPYAINARGDMAGYGPPGLTAAAYIKGKVIDLGISNAYGYAINTWGDVVGGAPAFLYHAGKVERVPAGAYSNNGINDRGQIIGQDGYFGFLREPSGYVRNLVFPGGATSAAYGINNLGQVVGVSEGGSEPGAFLYSGGYMQPIGDFTPSSINDHGQIVGQMPAPRGAHACLYAAGHLIDLGILPGTTQNESEATGINDLGKIVGNCRQGDFSVPFIWEDGVMRSIVGKNTPTGWRLGPVYGINNAGQIVGIMYGPSEEIPSHGVLLTP